MAKLRRSIGRRGHGFAMLLAAGFSSFPVAGENLVVGMNATWTRSVSNRGPGTTHDGSTPRAPLILWMTYQGSAEALDHLRENGALPIRHRWSVAAGGEVEVEPPDESFTERLSVPLTVGSSSQTVINKLAGQVASRESFAWRTWSKKESVSRGTWRVEVLYDDDTPVNCHVGGLLQPCVFRIKVR